jgi:double zinc ribbon protein
MDALDRTFRHLVQTIQARYPAYLAQPFEVAELYQNILPYRHHRRELGLDTNQDYELVLLQLLSGARDYLVVDDQMRERLARELASTHPDPGAFREFSTSQIALSPAAVRRVQSGVLGDAEPVLATAGRATSTEPTQRFAPHRAQAAAGMTASAPSAAAPNSGPITAPAPRRAPAPIPASVSPTVPAAPGPAATSASTASTPTTAPRAAATVATGARPTNTIVPQAGELCRYCNGALPAGRRITFCPHCGQNLTVVNCLACGTELELGWKFCTTCGRPAASV